MFKRRKKLFISLLIIMAVLICIRYWPREKLTDNIKYSTAVYDVNGELLRLSLADDQIFRLYTPLNEISQELQDITLFYEDRFFRYHPGFNPMALVRGFITSYIKKDRMMGGSTITMQLSRAIYGIDSTTIFGKLNQIVHSVWIEMRYSKDDILEAYLNLAPYGHNIEGVGAASLVYYGKRAQGLSLLESSTLCVIPQNPVKRVPTTNKGWEELTKARNPLVESWVQKYPEDSEKLDLFQAPMKIYKLSDMPFKAPHFVNGVMAKNIGISEIFSTLDLNLQNILENEIKEYIERNRVFGIKNAAALLINTDDMSVLASVGSADFFDDEIEGQVDGTRALRSPGSALKPFIYGLAVDKGVIHPHTILKDSPKRYGIYSPENSDRSFIGPIFAKDALNQSRNIPAVDLLLAVGEENFLEVLKKANVKKLKNVEYYGSALALGGFEVTMEDVAVMYASLNNEGQIKTLKKLKNEKIFEGESVLTKEAAYIVRDMIRGNPQPTGGIYATKPSFPVGWKTGTSYMFKDGWTASVFGKYVLVVWIGNFSGEGNQAFLGRYSVAPLMFRVINKITPYIEQPIIETDIPVDLNLKYVEICAVTGELPTDFCPRFAETLFIPGVSPIKISEIFLEIPIDIKTGLRACYHDPKTSRLEVFEFWPADILRIYEQAGIKKKTPPRYLPDCKLEATSSQGLPPLIHYPLSNVIYDIDNSPSNEIPLNASSSGDVEKIYWFIDACFIGESKNGEPLMWKASPGKHSLQAVDNLGRASSIEFDVI